MPRRVAEAAFVQYDECPKKRIAPNGNKLPDPIREGEILTDSSGKSWKLGRSIGIGGFGEIYLASDEIHRNVSSNTRYVIKVEQYSNGPLFVEKNFYIRTAKPEQIGEWRRQKKLKHLGISQYFGSGSHLYRGERYRFLVMERFGQDLGKLFIQHKRHFHVKTVLYLGIQILDVLEYIHCHGFVHADVKASNLILGRTPEMQNSVYLVDFGLACKYREKDGSHKEYRPDNRKAHAGTMEYTSRDAHVGAYSRRADLETLGYNLLQWLCGRLPWEDSLSDGEAVHACKNNMMSNLSLLMRQCFPDGTRYDVVSQYLKYVSALTFDATPDYAYCRRLLRSGVNGAGFVDDGKLVFGSGSVPLLAPNKLKKKSTKRGATEEPENIAELKPKKIVRIVPRQPCVAHNLNRMTRNSHMPIVLRSQQFNWEKVLSSHPERQLKKLSRPVVRAEPPLSNEEPVRKHTPTTPSRPTPAMLSVLARKKERNSSGAAALRKTRSDSSRSCSPMLESSPFGALTYAMEEVLKRREELAAMANVPFDFYEGDDSDLECLHRVTRSGHRVFKRRSPRLKFKRTANIQSPGGKRKAVINQNKKCRYSPSTHPRSHDTLRG
ncbi:hypothetical protein R5R35_008660 [Gryllus longicercus]|uniref:non-specific serine/threonine protein kinase n=2 Tax=Gryllus longicercus TaxID=2509291 RepID=A0AAN9YWW0_9ORTH